MRQEEVVQSVYFDFDKFHLDEKQGNAVVDFIKNTDSTRIESIQIFGYTDDVGKDAYNFQTFLEPRQHDQRQTRFEWHQK